MIFVAKAAAADAAADAVAAAATTTATDDAKAAAAWAAAMAKAEVRFSVRSSFLTASVCPFVVLQPLLPPQRLPLNRGLSILHPLCSFSYLLNTFLDL